MLRLRIGVRNILFLAVAGLAFSAPAPTNSPQAEDTTATNATLRDGASQPVIVCSDDTITIHDKSTVFHGHLTVLRYLNSLSRNLSGQLQCSDSGYRSWPISQKVLSCYTNRDSTPIHMMASILQAYSVIAQQGSESGSLTEEVRAMQIIHELLNRLISSYFYVISPETCNCTSGDSCVVVEDLSKGLNLENFPDNCNSSAYVLQNLLHDMDWMVTALSMNIGAGVLTRSNCQTWINTYIPQNSEAYSLVNSTDYCDSP